MEVITRAEALRNHETALLVLEISKKLDAVIIFGGNNTIVVGNENIYPPSIFVYVSLEDFGQNWTSTQWGNLTEYLTDFEHYLSKLEAYSYAVVGEVTLPEVRVAVSSILELCHKADH